MKHNEPIWFDEENKEVEVHNINLGSPKYKILVATPVHSECSIHYTQALLKFQQNCMKNGILVSFALLKSSLVTQGRNLCVANFLGDENEYTHLLFIDSDIDFKFETIMKMLSYDKEVVSTPYPMKHLDWDRIWKQIEKNRVGDAETLKASGFIFPIKMEGMETFEVKNGLMKVSHAPTGCMLIKRQVFDKMIKAYPELKIEQPTIINGKPTSNPHMWNFFDTYHDPKTKNYYGEDFYFCKKWTNIGGEIYCYTLDYITHVGEYQFSGRFMDNLQHAKRIDEE